MQGFGSKLLTAAAAVLLVASCSDEKMGELDVPGGAGNVTIKLTSLPVGSRATENDDNGYENLMQDALICLFKVGATAETDHPVVMQYVDVSARTEKDVTLQINKDKIDELFPTGVDQAIVHVFANLPAATKAAIPDNPTLGELNALTVSSNFASRQQPSSFVMNGDSELTINRNVNNTSKDEVEGSVRLKRAAAKISLNLRVKSSVTDLNGREWTPVLGDGMQVYINNGVNTSAVTPSTHTLAPSDYYFTSASSTDANEKGRTFTKNENENEETGYPYALNSPFYTYPNQWTDESETMTFMTLLVPWECKEEGSYRSCYYMVPVVRDQNHLDRNVSYRVSINIDILGNSKPDDPLVIEDASYRAVPWGTESFDVAIKDFRYLVIDNNTYTMNNEGLINIPFYSSHETVIKYDLDTLNYYLFNNTVDGIEKEMTVNNTQRNNSSFTPTINNTTAATYSAYRDSIGTPMKMYSDWIDNTIDQSTNTRSLYFHHELYQWNAYSGNNPISYTGYSSVANANATLSTITRYALPATSSNAYSRYRMSLTIVHKDKLGKPDEAQFSEKIVIWQYPPMYIEADPNKYILNSNRPFGTAEYGNTYVNGTSRTSTQNTDPGSMVPGGLVGNNRNPNMYIVSITQLSDDRYQVGDPRSTSIDNLDYNNWTTAPAIGETVNRKLKYYYPTDGSNSTKFIVAPKLRIASSYGVSGTMNQTSARQRCAGYQELNCPAGRWRLPTYGELEYIINLSNNGKIPELFSSTGRYWTAQGGVSGAVDASGHLGNTSTNNSNVRCVYDEWYWGDSKVPANGTVSWTYNRTTYTTTKYLFTWGDKQR